MIRSVLIVVAVAILSQFETFNLGCTVSAQTGCTPCIRPDPDPNKKVENKPANVTVLALSDEILVHSCPPGHIRHPAGKSPSASMDLDAAVTALDPEDDVLTYNYTVSGGRIVGTGANVKWDLSEAAPGTYTITSGVDDGCGICGMTQTKTVTVEACNNIVDCVCASVEIAGPIGDVLTAGENTFTANVAVSNYDPTYEWSVDGGEIVSGQGTASIIVKFEQKSIRSNKAVTVRIGGAPSECACATEDTVEYVNRRRKV